MCGIPTMQNVIYHVPGNIENKELNELITSFIYWHKNFGQTRDKQKED
jgi:hypothetical protein